MPVRRLFDIAKTILKTHAANVQDVGDVPYGLIRDILLLPAVKAPQLRALEARSPHLCAETEEVWKSLCIRDFVGIRIAVEDGRMDDPASWRELHRAEEIKRDTKMEQILAKMRGSYKDHREERATTKQVDGVQAAKRRRINVASTSSSRPKTLFDKVRSTSRSISAMYAPPRRQPAPVKPSELRLGGPSRTPHSHITKASTTSTVTSNAPPPPKVVTFTREVRINAPRRVTTTPLSAPSASRLIAPLPSRSASQSAPSALGGGPPSGAVSPTAAPNHRPSPRRPPNGMFLPKTWRAKA